MIKKVGRIILVGTSHVGKDDIKKIEAIIEKEMPDVVGIELDSKRFKSLMDPNKDTQKMTYKQKLAAMKEFGTFGFMFAQLAGYVQKKIGKQMDINPGIDMKTAYLKARELNIPVSLIDQDIKITLKKMSKLSFFKKIGMVSSLFFKSFKKEYRELLNFDLKKVPQEKVIRQMIGILKKESPHLYNILIHQRNIYMSKRLLKLCENHNGQILAIVGAGHVEGMEEYLKKHIKKIESRPNNNNNNKNSISFSFQSDIDNSKSLI